MKLPSILPPGVTISGFDARGRFVLPREGQVCLGRDPASELVVSGLAIGGRRNCLFELRGDWDVQLRLGSPLVASALPPLGGAHEGPPAVSPEPSPQRLAAPEGEHKTKRGSVEGGWSRGAKEGSGRVTRPPPEAS